MTVRICFDDRCVARGRCEGSEAGDVRAHGSKIDRELAAHHDAGCERAATIQAIGTPKKSVCATNWLSSANVLGRA